MSHSNRPIIWVGEPKGFCQKAKVILESNAVVIYQKVNQEQLPEVFNNCDAFIFRLALKIGARDIPKQPRCKIIATPITGLDHIDLQACLANNVQVISLKGDSELLKEVRATAEHTFALLLALTRRIVPASQLVSQKYFDRDLFQGQELYQKTFGIIGYGRLGKIVANYASAFGMKVLIYEIDNSKIPINTDFEFVGLNDLLAQSDFVSLQMDANNENLHLVNEAFLSRMKKTSFLINTSRGSLIDESALVNALERKIIAGAALDVVDGEPAVNFDNSLFKFQRSHSNLLITPHIGGNTAESFEKTECFIANKIIQQLVHA